MSLKQHNYEVTEGECPSCEDGSLWVNTHELVCGECHLVFRNNTKQIANITESYEEPVIEFYQRRSSKEDEHRYDSSKMPILPGGFESAYDGDGIYGDDKDEETLLDTRRRA